MIESSNTPEAFSEHAKSIMTLRSGKVIEHTSKTNETDPKPLTEAKSPKNKKDLKIEKEPTTPKSSYLPKAPFLDALKRSEEHTSELQHSGESRMPSSA